MTVNAFTMSHKTYIAAPTRSTPPDGPILLGNIIASPRNPEDSLNDNEPVSLNNNYFRAYEKGWSHKTEHHHDTSGGFFTQFFQIDGLGSDIDFQHKSSKAEELSGDLEISWFNPQKPYINQSIQHSGVQSYLESNKFREPVYMITGVMVLRGAAALNKNIKERGFHTQVGVDLSALSVPVSVGPKLGVSGGTQNEVASSEISDFVLAFRLTRIKVKRDGRVESDRYTKGASYSLDSEVGDTVIVPEIATIEVEEDDMTAEALNLNVEAEMKGDNGSWDFVVLPR